MNIKSALEGWSMYEESVRKIENNTKMSFLHSSVRCVNNVTYMRET
jgi:hypothetical protein